MEGVEELLEDSALQSDQDEMNEDKKAVRLMTVHASKGLEFDVVFISGLEDGLFPHQKINEANITPSEAEEERRLFYVALTRAKKKIYLSYAQMRMIFGHREVNVPSEFILDIPDDLIEEELFEGDEEWRKKPLLDIPFD
jgi:DNA helicase-2/ATP-dependent DNA helicase PcrA